MARSTGVSHSGVGSGGAAPLSSCGEAVHVLHRVLHMHRRSCSTLMCQCQWGERQPGLAVSFIAPMTRKFKLEC